MNDTNICWECRHEKLKLQILVPKNHTIEEYANKTGGFQSDIVAITKEKQGQYNVWFRSGGNLRLLSFKMLHECKLKRGKEESRKVVACKNYELRSVQNTICNILYSKTPEQEPTEC